MIEVRVRRAIWDKKDAVKVGKFKPTQIPALVGLMEDRQVTGFCAEGDFLFDEQDVETHGLVVDEDESYYEVITN